MDDQNKTPDIDLSENQSVPSDDQLPPPKRQVFAWLKYKHSQLTPKQKVLVTIGMVLLVILAAFTIYQVYRHFHQSLGSSLSKQAENKTTEPSRLTGVEVSPKLNKRPVTGIMIENSLDARPQSGLLNAGVVYEAVAEGGITRFLALYQEAQPKYIGPVRSVRPYYLDWLMPFKGSIAHVGGAPRALQDIRAYRIHDLDQFFNPGAYSRIAERAPPHNVYTKMANLDALNKAKGFKGTDFPGFPRKPESPASKSQRNANRINLSISSFNFGVSYTYSPSKNIYLRRLAGSAHTDLKSHKQLAPKVVIAMVIHRGIDSDGQHTKYATKGSGRVFVFQDGKVTIGTWKKSTRTTQVHFYKKDGSEISLNPGQTWITVVDSTSSVSFRR